ncbi:hypothetical protein H6F43_18040 [Leptolyngbya sp. FACHB-36]|uniref:L-dopachrome tautomerase-related protein n=1 Tax=Leptolyngbya sp. FACHB-36 TaxID=2692808 RepID=UPI001680ECF4|nr:L-dopachrome tautomerase-related protein [Leptolyngbya sp. FACHB-36]MBD2022082.1 hypothetical protein [Leptolyngbya sp. FACHB-36]
MRDRRWLRWLLCGLCFLIGVASVGLVAPAIVAQTAPTLETVAELSSGPGNITVTPTGRILLSLHQFYAPSVRVAELASDNKLMPFPNAEWNQAGRREASLDAVLGIQSDPNSIVWMLDNGMRGSSIPKLVGWDWATHLKQMAQVIQLPQPITAADSFVNDLAVDATHNAIYIADPAGGKNAALIVVNSATGTARRVLQGHTSVIPENVDLVIDNVPVQIRQPNGSVVRPRIGVNPIALDRRNEWLYYGPMHGTSLYRIRTADLRNPDLSDADLARRVQRYSAKPICDGISIDNDGNIYLGDLATNSIGVITSRRRYQTLIKDARLSWVDAFSFGPDGLLYTVVNQLHRTSTLNGGENRSQPPYYVFRFKPLAAGVAGR